MRQWKYSNMHIMCAEFDQNGLDKLFHFYQKPKIKIFFPCSLSLVGHVPVTTSIALLSTMCVKCANNRFVRYVIWIKILKEYFPFGILPWVGTAPCLLNRIVIDHGVVCKMWVFLSLSPSPDDVAHWKKQDIAFPPTIRLCELMKNNRFHWNGLKIDWKIWLRQIDNKRS